MNFGALEAGGTKMVMAIFDQEGGMLRRESIPTKTPEETMPSMISFFREGNISALGIGCFGPLELHREAANYGCITTTPKRAWVDYPILSAFQDALNVPVELDTDVNAAALAEARLGAARGLGSCLYVTVGTGVGAGLVINGEMVHGLLHPEMGHIPVTPDERDPAPRGFCYCHAHCLEGMAAGPAIEKRWGVSAKELPRDHVGWDIESNYLGQLCATAMLSFSPEKIILGGGVMQQAFLLPLVREKTLALLAGYLSHPCVENGLRDYIVAPGLDVRSGITGAYLLARKALESA